MSLMRRAFYCPGTNAGRDGLEHVLSGLSSRDGVPALATTSARSDGLNMRFKPEGLLRQYSWIFASKYAIEMLVKWG